MSQPLNVLITVPLDEALLAELRNLTNNIRILNVPAQSPDDIAPELWASCDVLYTAKILPAPEQAPQLKWIQFHYAGIDHALDAPILQRDGLLVTTLSGANAAQMAEYVLTMLLALGHRLPDLFKAQRAAEWPADRWQRFMPQELRGSTVGIVGYGAIGRQIARLLHAFGAIVLANKRDATDPRYHGYIAAGQGDPNGDYVRRLYPAEALRAMARHCQALVVTVPLTPQTRHLINAEVFNALPDGAFLVDVSRGGVVDHEALLSALQNGRLDGAALDVFPQEPLPPESPLWQMENVIITPHISGNSPHYKARAMTLFKENLRRYLDGKPLYNLFDPQKGY